MQDDNFQVDRSATKHDGFFVNRGKLERMYVYINLYVFDLVCLLQPNLPLSIVWLDQHEPFLL